MGKWALVLGASSGFGEACSLELARNGFDIAGVHLDRRATLPNVERITSQIRELGREALFFNMNAADEEGRKKVVEALGQRRRPAEPGDSQPSGSPVVVLLHSLAFGTLRPYVGDRREECLTQKQLEMTVDVMANSLVYWAQDLVFAGLMGEGGRIFAMTSAGSTRVWPFYGAVSAAKAALESHCRQLAVELAGRKISVNAIRAGVTDTPALRKIPGSEELVQNALKYNPSGRLTTPGDVAHAVVMLSRPEAGWITGNTIGVDGGEYCVT